MADETQAVIVIAGAVLVWATVIAVFVYNGGW